MSKSLLNSISMTLFGQSHDDHTREMREGAIRDLPILSKMKTTNDRIKTFKKAHKSALNEMKSMSTSFYQEWKELDCEFSRLRGELSIRYNQDNAYYIVNGEKEPYAFDEKEF